MLLDQKPKDINLVFLDVHIFYLYDCSCTVFVIGLFYYTLGNIDPKYRSCLDAIQLLCVVKTDVITKFGINEVLRPFVEDMLQLEKVNVIGYFMCTVIIIHCNTL